MGSKLSNHRSAQETERMREDRRLARELEERAKREREETERIKKQLMKSATCVICPGYETLLKKAEVNKFLNETDILSDLIGMACADRLRILESDITTLSSEEYRERAIKTYDEQKEKVMSEGGYLPIGPRWYWKSAKVTINRQNIDYISLF